MRRTLGLLFITLFLSVQMLSLLHMAEYHFEKHTHNGKVCSIYLYCQQSKSSATVTPVILPPPSFVEARLPGFIAASFIKEIFNSASPRAPPVFLRD